MDSCSLVLLPQNAVLLKCNEIFHASWTPESYINIHVIMTLHEIRWQFWKMHFPELKSASFCTYFNHTVAYSFNHLNSGYLWKRNNWILRDNMVIQWLALSPHSVKVQTEFKPASQLGSLCVEFTCSPHACERGLQVLWFSSHSPKTCRKATLNSPWVWM